MGLLDGLFGAKNNSNAAKTNPQQQVYKRPKNFNWWEHIKCPYCFEEFSHENVSFRSETGFTSDFISEKEIELEREEDETKKRYLSLTIQNTKNYEIKQDRVYAAFWKKMVGDENYENDKYCQMPCLSTEEGNFNEKIYDQDGFLEAIKDKAGKKTERRICPYCHNILPKFYGKYEVKFLSVVGITSSGKTVYLSQLIDNLEEDLYKVGCSVMYSMEATEFRKSHTVRKGYPLPAGTVVRFVPPLFFTVQGKRNVTLVAYDIAGEACVDVENIATYGSFIKNSDGILMLIDPGQFKGLHAALENVSAQITEDEKASPTAVLSAVHGAFTGGSNERSNIPLAITISKSDMLFDITDSAGDLLIPFNSNIRQDVAPTQDRRFNYIDYQNVNADVSIMVSRQFPALHTTITNNFTKYGYFAVSALGCDVEYVETGDGLTWTPATDPMPLRIEEPFCWILKEWDVIN
ncbi:MAG: hypothetical protein IJH94_01470 [Clostridia bacterium]|nr:hypothetical protein [Clostridia bacterium]